MRSTIPAMEAAAHRWSGSPADLELDGPPVVCAPVPLPPGVAAHEASKKADGMLMEAKAAENL